MTRLDPCDPQRRSPLDAWHCRQTGGQLNVDGMATPVRLCAANPPCDAVIVTDVSWRRRFGVKGPAAEGWLVAEGYPPTESANSWTITNGALVARLGTSEFLIESVDDPRERVAATSARLGSLVRPAGVYPVARQDLVVHLHGGALNALLRQICSVDFAPILAAVSSASGQVVLTSMIGVGVVAVPRSTGAAPELTLWLDPSFANYFWTTLTTIASELGGGIWADPLNETRRGNQE